MHVINPSPFQNLTLNTLGVLPMFRIEVIYLNNPSPVQKDDVPYEVVLRSHHAQQTDTPLDSVQSYLQSLTHPDSLSDAQYMLFIQYCLQFFVDSAGRLWRKDLEGRHCVVVAQMH